MAAKKGLGKGFESLFGENTAESEDFLTVKINNVEPNKNQPRRTFDEGALQELAESIQKHGLIQPIIVQPLINGNYGIIAGERRWRACRIAGLKEIPVIVKNPNDRELMEMALIENLQREDLNIVEEAKGYKALIDSYDLTQEEVASAVGKSRSAVTNTLRLLNLADNELIALQENKITAGHARALLACEGEQRQELFNLALGGASVRELEKFTKKANRKGGESTEKIAKGENIDLKKPTFYTEVELSLRDELHRKIEVKPTANGGGALTIEFYNNDELAEFARRLAKGNN